MKNEVKVTATRENSAQKGGIYILRIATILLAIVSWWATAQGMANYVFEKEWQAYLASLAIQSILLGLNFYLPTFWRYTTSDASKWGLGILSAIVLFCSSWFSYVYIVEKTYQESWNTYSRLLVQSVYREELYGAMDYTEEYEEILRDSLGTQIRDLYIRAKDIELSSSQTITPLDLTQDRTNYAENTEFTAQREILSAIQAVENALAESASASDRETAANQLYELQTQVDEQIATLSDTIEQTKLSVTDAETRVQTAQNRLDNALDGTDTTSLESALDSAQQNYNNRQSDLERQQKNLSDYRTAQLLLQQYAGHLNLSSIGTRVQISNSLRGIQSDLLNGEVEVIDIEEKARGVFEQFQASEDTLDADETVYQTVLNELDRFIRNVQKYGEAKASGQMLNTLADELVSDLQTNTSTTNSDWKANWIKKLENLKAVIGGIPSYTDSDDSILTQYDRINSMDQLDDALRNYISSHNAADQAIIYLLHNPHRALAVFSFLLALFLDISAFITGFIIDIVERHQTKRQYRGSTDTVFFDEEQNTDIQSDCVSTPPTAQRYLFLTGDYTREDEKYYYHALEGNAQLEIMTPEKNLLPGFHVEVNGKLSAIVPQEVSLFRMPNGPSDGIYLNCYLQYSDHMLCIKKESMDDFQYLATMDEDVPVYMIRKGECVCLDAQDIPTRLLSVVILALNNKGTQVEAIYLEV